MYNIQISGCITTILFTLLICLILKELWWLFAGIALICIISYYINFIIATIKQKQKEVEQNYTPQMGEVFKVCPFCNTKVKVTATTCPCCNRTLN